MIHDPFVSVFEANVQVSSCAKHLPRAGQYDHFHTLVYIKHWVDFFEVMHHIHGECISFMGPIQCHDDDWCCDCRSGWVMRELDGSCW